VRTTASWVSSFGVVAELTSLGADARMWVPGPWSATMNLFAAVLARWVGAEVAGGPGDATHAHLTPHQLRRLLDEGVPVAGLRVTVAGDRLPASLHARAVGAGARVDHYYGAAELSFVGWGSNAERLHPFPGAEVRVRDGELWVRSPYLCQGYAGAAGPLRRDAEGFATVGDRGRLVDGLLTVTGRGDAVVTTGGATVEVADVEEVLRPVVAGEVVVLGRPHEVLGQVVAAVLTERGDHRGAWLAAQAGLDRVRRPRLWYAVPRLPLTPAGKVDRAALAGLLDDPSVARLSGSGR
jgi:acyl-CoA synthetase (AMP-forming)/AMP-acid ligase II